MQKVSEGYWRQIKVQRCCEATDQCKKYAVAKRVLVRDAWECQVCHRQYDQLHAWQFEETIAEYWVIDAIPYNHIQVWMELIATPENAKKLRARLDRLAPPVLDPSFGPEPAQCPTTVLYGSAKSNELYTNPRYQRALDMWDTGEITARDLKVWCLAIENQKGP